jgi:hypothetical protein
VYEPTWRPGSSEGESTETLRDVIDLHAHSAPDVEERLHDDLELATQAAHWGMRAVVLKSHVESTVGRAAITARAAGIDVFGGLVLNFAVTGGISSTACETALRLGGRAIWMPTKSSLAHNRALAKDAQRPLSVVAADDAGELKRICELVTDAGAFLSTGHAAPDEIRLIAVRCRAVGAKLVLTHPDWLVPALSIGDQADLADEFPEIIFERCAFSISEANPTPIHIARTVQAIRAVGIERNVVSSDLGQATGLAWPNGLALFARELEAAGLSNQEVSAMMRDRPAELLFG